MTIELLPFFKEEKQKVSLALDLDLNSDDEFNQDDYEIDAISPGKVVEGKIVSISKDMVLVSIGYKSDGQIPIKEFGLDDKHKLEIGSSVMVYIEKLEDKDGNLIISYDTAKYLDKWGRLEECWDNNTEVTGKIVHILKSGCIVDVDGISAFLPRSHISLKQISSIESAVTPLMGTAMQFMILKMDTQQRNIVLSRKMVLDYQNVDAKKEFLDSLEIGQELIGRVRTIYNYGVFVQIFDTDEFSIDGLLHITDMAWERVSHPSSIYSSNETIKVKIININKENGKISLGVKQLTENPWVNIEVKYPIGYKTEGKVISIEDYGIFVELESGIEGLVHISELSWIRYNASVHNFNKGDKVSVMILNIDSVKNRMSLSIKKCLPNPWLQFSENNKLGSKISGTIKNILDFGIFVEISGVNGIEGLVKIHDISHDSYDKNIDQHLRKYKVGDSIDVKLLHINVSRSRILLGIKQLSHDPYEEYIKKLNNGDVIMSVVKKVEDDEIYVQVFGFDNVGFFVPQEVLNNNENYNIEDKILLKVLSIDGYQLKLEFQNKIGMERQQ